MTVPASIALAFADIRLWEIHPKLVAFPIAFLLGAVALDLVSSWRGRLEGRNAATSLMRAGFWLGLLAAAAGLLAIFTVPAHTEHAHDLMHWHAALAALALVLFGAVLWARRKWRTTGPRTMPTLFGVLAAFLIVAVAYLGGLIVFRGGAGIDPKLLAPEVLAVHTHAKEGGHEHVAQPDEHAPHEKPERAGAHEHDQHGAERQTGKHQDGQHEEPLAPPEQQHEHRHDEHDGRAQEHDAPRREAKDAAATKRERLTIPLEGLSPGKPGDDYTPVITPNGVALPWKVVDGVKVFHLVAEEVEHEFAPGLVAKCWGYNGRVHGPTIEAVEGDRVRIYVTNRLAAPTSVHWHGILLPNGMDGVAGLTQRSIPPGDTFRYEFTLRQHGTHMYHSHHDEMTQMALGLMGLLVIHPRAPTEPRPDRDFAILLSEWRIDPGVQRPDPVEMTDFNVVTLNAKVFPATAPLVVKLGERVRIRFANLSAMDHHPMHLHGYQFKITETDGGQIAASAQQVETTVLVQVGSSKTIEFAADAPGDWALHCHMTHHLMNQMGHDVPNMVGVDVSDLDAKVRPLLPDYMTMGQTGMADMGEMKMKMPRNSIAMMNPKGPFDPITMGGMFTILKVREGITSYDDPGWFEHPMGTVAEPAKKEELERDAIEVGERRPAADKGAAHKHDGHGR